MMRILSLLALLIVPQSTTLTWTQAHQEAIVLLGPTAITAEVRRSNTSALERWAGIDNGAGGIIILGFSSGTNWRTALNSIKSLPSRPQMPQGTKSAVLDGGYAGSLNLSLGEATRAQLREEYPYSPIEANVSSVVRGELTDRWRLAQERIRALDPANYDRILAELEIWAIP